MKKSKILKLVALGSMFGVVAVTPIITTSCSKKKTSTSVVVPVVKSTVSYDGDLTNVFGTNGTNEQIKKSLDKLLNESKDLVIENFSSINSAGQANDLKIVTTITSGDDSKWESESVSKQSSNEQNTVKKLSWAGRNNQANKSEIIKFDSIKELKTIFSGISGDDIVKNALNSLEENKDNKITTTLIRKLNINFFKEPIKLNKNNLEISISITKKDNKDTNLDEQINKISGNYILEIPQQNIKFNPTFKVDVTYRGGKILSKENVVLDFAKKATSLI
ncbi:hypothetical protein [Malacoplasma iowae]|uniref:Uncharacterized protein n=1 Tax=Malacoplasma iowae 695 TaxID=1048830 RepID=A0A6P1LFA1_MALIO|nr:hypothetical protein [Malacoplasma iowae]VEU61779.1 Uncharacterised protein [Mycoplasmopsis fermentans]EGZ31327.1 hypothetical protein GUU_00135 [Malacoplasma iowae 695]QHG90128.1 hypothetical protein EER00_04560 [Malacoplasma iowae 695]WPL36133.1 hypothetical protein QX180_01790 [Malacoplasma iowae]VEU71033.1 Uncharacterised protein [Malacoplasma iowae]